MSEPESKSESLQPKFKVGDLVQHRASRRRGVVIQVNYHCVNPQHQSAMGMPACYLRKMDDCQKEFSGSYELSLDVQEQYGPVFQGILELVHGDD